MKYIGKYLSEEIFLIRECSYQNVAADNFLNISSSYVLFFHTFILWPQTTVPIIKIRYVLKRISLNSLILNHNGQFFYLVYMTWTVLWWFLLKIYTRQFYHTTSKACIFFFFQYNAVLYIY